MNDQGLSGVGKLELRGYGPYLFLDRPEVVDGLLNAYQEQIARRPYCSTRKRKRRKLVLFIFLSCF